MNPDDYCQQKAAPPGSSLYYAVREAKAAQRPLLVTLHTFWLELRETVDDCTDPGVARAKLAWWQRETAALADPGSAAPAHPVLRALAEHLPERNAENSALQALVTAFDLDLEQARYADFAALERHLDAAGGEFAALQARMAQNGRANSDANADANANANADANTVETWARPLGRALLLAEMVAHVGEHARHGRIYLPIEDLQRFGVPAADIVQRRYSDAFTELMGFEATRAREHLQAAVAAIPPRERRRQASLRAQAALALATLDEVASEDYRVLHQRVALTPLRKLWVAWRAARRR